MNERPADGTVTAVSRLLGPDGYEVSCEECFARIDEYVELMKEADARRVPLYVNNGFPTALRIDFPGVFAMLEDAGLFEHVAYFAGVDVMLDRMVTRYRPGGLQRADLGRYKQLEGSRPRTASQ